MAPAIKTTLTAHLYDLLSSIASTAIQIAAVNKDALTQRWFTSIRYSRLTVKLRNPNDHASPIFPSVYRAVRLQIAAVSSPSEKATESRSIGTLRPNKDSRTPCTM